MKNNLFKMVLVTALVTVAASCGGRDTDNGTDNGTQSDVPGIDINAYDISGIDINGIDVNSIDGLITNDVYDQDGPIAQVQKTDLSVVCPPDGSDTAPGFQNGDSDLVMDVVVTAPMEEASSNLIRYFVAEATLSTATPWTGAAMTVKTDLGLPDFEVGDVLTVTVSHLEYYCMTQLQVSAASRLDSGKTLAPADADAADLSGDDPSKTEPYEPWREEGQLQA